MEDHKDSVEGCDAVIDISTNDSNSGEGRAKLSHEEQDQPCTLKGYFHFAKYINNLDSKCTPHQAANNTSDIQEDQNMLVEETSEVDSSDDAEKNEDDDLALADTPYVEDALHAHEGEVGRDDDPPQEEQSISSETVNDAPRVGLLDSSTSENEHKNECLDLDHEEKPMMYELGNADTNNTSCVVQDQPSDQEINQLLIRCSSDPMDMIKENREHILDDADPTDQNMLEKAVHWESEPSSPTENDHETEGEATEKCVVELQSSMEIDTHRLSNQTAVAETPPNLPGVQFSDGSESKRHILDSNPSNIGAQVELRKSPSFDFGISFDTRSEESDQTPLLYQDRTARRSLSSCSNLRFQNSSVQTEYVGKPLQFESVQVEEKTIRMERSNSESSQALNTNKQENANVVTKEAHKNSSNASPSRDDEATISPKGNSKRKSRSSLFTTCICCTAAIS